MSRHEEEIDGESRCPDGILPDRVKMRQSRDRTDDYQCLTNDAMKRQAIRAQKMGVISDEIDRCERRLVYLRQDLARLRREGEPQLPLGDQPTFAPEWPNQRKSIDRGQ